MQTVIPITLLITTFYSIVGFSFSKLTAAATGRDFDFIVFISWPLAAIVFAFIKLDHN